MSDEGFHNESLDTTIARLKADGSWKNQRIVTIIPSGSMIPFRVALSHRNLIFPPNQGCVWLGAEGTEVGQAYSGRIGDVLADPTLSQWEYILTVEHDNLPPADGVLQLLRSMEKHPEYCAISGLYFTKGFGGVAQCWGDPSDPVLNFRPILPKPGQVIEVNGIGMGFALWRMSLFKDERLRRPWFKTQAGLDGCGTQDLYMAADAKKHGYRFAVDCSVKVGHYDHDGKFGIRGMVW